MKNARWLGLMAVLPLAGPALAATLQVGPGKTYQTVASALKDARDGDVIEIDAKGVYERDVAYVNASRLTIRGVGGASAPASQPARAVLDAKGTCAGRKGIFVIRGNDVTVENIEFRNAGGEVNAAGIRAEGVNLTVRNCRFFECRDAILGGAGDVLIEHCEFSHCGHNSNPATHNLYMSERVNRLTYRCNYSTHTYEGHLLKSRAKENWILYNRLTDEAGEGSAVADFPNGGLVVLVGNVMHKGPNGKNNRMAVFGMEGLIRERNEFYVVNNTMYWDNRRPGEMAFVYVRTRAKAAGGATSRPEDKDVKVVIRNNVCIGPLALTNAPRFDAAGNLMLDAKQAGLVFADPARFDFSLKPGSPTIDYPATVDCGKVDDFELTPKLQYVHPHDSRPRPTDGKLDAGAFEFSK